MKKLKVGIVGLGRIAVLGHIPEISKYPDRFEIVAVADIIPERLEESHTKLSGVKKYTSLSAMLEDDEVEMITIATRHPDHVPMALEILDAGKIAVVEKPVACSMKEMAVLEAAAAKHPGKLFFRHNRRYEPAFRKALELASGGIIGDVHYIKLYRSVGFCRRNDWMTMTEFYGGLLSNWGPHLIDQALQFIGAPAEVVFADVRRVVSIGDGDDTEKIILRGTNGRLADIEISGANAMPGREMEIVGSRGAIVFDGGKGKIKVRSIDPCVTLRELKPHPETPPLRYGNADERLYFVESEYEVPDGSTGDLWAAIHDDVVNGIPCPVTIRQAAEVVRITEEAFAKSKFAPIGNFKSKLS